MAAAERKGISRRSYSLFTASGKGEDFTRISRIITKSEMQLPVTRQELRTDFTSNNINVILMIISTSPQDMI